MIAGAASQQVPPPGKINLDHLAHFVPDIDSASAALERLGFTLTPFSAQSHRLEPGGPLVTAGSGNRCVMLQQGYLEFLTPTADTPIAHQLRAAIDRYVGVHLIAFGTAAPDADRQRLAAAGFAPLAPVALQREIETPSGCDTARFTVVRVPPGTMAEGRVQYCQHHTPHLLWQERWLGHPNGARALAGVLLCVDDPRETAQRYARFTGLPLQSSGGVWRLDAARGTLLFIGVERLQHDLGLMPPARPWIAGCVLLSEDIAASAAYLRDAKGDVEVLDKKRMLVRLPPDVGSIVLFVSSDSTHFAFD